MERSLIFEPSLVAFEAPQTSIFLLSPLQFGGTWPFGSCSISFRCVLAGESILDKGYLGILLAIQWDS